MPYLEGALERDPSSALAAGTLAGALRRRGHAEAAIPLYERSIRLSPHGPRVHHAYGGLSLARLSEGDFEAALRCARRAVEGDPASGQGKALDFFPVIPACLALLGRIDEAKAAWAAAGPTPPARGCDTAPGSPASVWRPWWRGCASPAGTASSSEARLRRGLARGLPLHRSTGRYRDARPTP